jgi:hypothetical protein
MTDGFCSVTMHGSANGIIPIATIGQNGNWYIGNKDTGIAATGEQGVPGPQGPQGIPGLDGVNGIDGADGATGPQGPQGSAGPRGFQGPQGPAGDLNTESIILRPDKWSEKIEIPLGNGLYGRRYRGFLNVPANTLFSEPLGTIGSTARFVTSGGWWSTTKHILELGSPWNEQYSRLALNDTGALGFGSICPLERIDAPYDIWLTYTK